MGEPILLFVLSLAGGGGGGQSKAVFVDHSRSAHHSLPGNSRATSHIGAALGEYQDQHPQDGLPRLKTLAWIPRGATLHTAKVELAFAATGLEMRLRQGWLQKGTAFVGGRDGRPAQQFLQKLLHLWGRLPVVQQLRALGRQRRSLIWPSLLPHPAPSGTRRLAETGSRAQEGGSSLPPALLHSREEEVLKPAVPAQRTLLNLLGSTSTVSGQPPVPKQGAQPSLPSLATEVGAAHEVTCRCPDSQHTKAPAQEVEGRQVGLRVPTPRTEEAAWAASALTFLLVVLTLAVLYTRLHQKCRRGPSLYWRTSSEEGRETVAAVMKRRLFSHHRRKRRLRQPPQQQRALLPSSSSDDSPA
ncbi:tumor protein p53-inducible protein 13 [Candoia aspera]|uniref:tumor protein p53-inducible protein 13 n=1 Tax=Candoia aspera TaxID=51853 RepID=UPI002FD7F9CE